MKLSSCFSRTLIILFLIVITIFLFLYHLIFIDISKNLASIATSLEYSDQNIYLYTDDEN
jgi:hypothetical protein